MHPYENINVHAASENSAVAGYTRTTFMLAVC